MSWWKEAVFYQIYPRSFNDSDGDGVGDIPGIVEKIEYIDELGVDAVWLNPVYESPQVDYGYDVSDYRSVHDEYGTMGDLEGLLEELHGRDIRLVMDLVVNHTSDEHDWFAKSRERDKKYSDYYVWREGKDGGPPNNWESAFGGSAWTYDEKREQYYLSLFHESQPDLNWRNPDVRDDVVEMVGWWLEKGVDGFRMDVINLLSKPEGLPDGDPERDWVGSEHFANGPMIHEYLTELCERAFEPHDAFTVGETPEITPEDAEEYSQDGLDMVIPFEHMELDHGDDVDWFVTDVDLLELKDVFSRWQEADCWTSLYWNNHDQPRAVSRFGDDEGYRVESAKMLATLVFTLRGTPFVYQGEEIGLTNTEFESLDEMRDTGTIERAETAMEELGIEEFDSVSEIVNRWARDNARTPMRWTDGEGAGFTDAGVEPWIKINTNHEGINVEEARRDEDSVWGYYRELVEMRKENPVFVHGDYEVVDEEHPEVYAYERSLEDDRALVVLNFFDGEATFTESARYDTDEPLVGNYDVDGSSDENLRPYEARVYRV